MHTDLSNYPSMLDEFDYQRIDPGRILIVDDLPEHSAISASVLTRVGGHAVQETTSPAEALRIAREWLPDVILLDILMPEMNGLELAKLLREADCDVKLMFVTSKDSTFDRVRGLRNGDQFLTKPFHPMVLLEMVDSLLRGRRRKHGDSLTHGEANDNRPILESNSHTVTFAPNRVVRLSPKLWELLRALIDANGAVVYKTQLLRDLWNAEDGDPTLVEVTINRLRNRIELDPKHPELIIRAKGSYYYNLKRRPR